MNNSQLKNNKFKEVSPVQTVEKIQEILKKIEIEVEEVWFPDSVIGTSSLRLNIKGTLIGSNGKGTNRDYARASAYAEFLERLQNNKLIGNATLSTVLRRKKQGSYLYINEKILDTEHLAQEENAFIKMFSDKRNVDYSDKGAVAKLLRGHQKMDYNILREKDKFLCNPYYSVKEGYDVHVPYFMANLHYGSNGMCAGNTRSEALVQGLSEIIERMVQSRIVMEQLELPDIPEEILKKYVDIYEMYLEIKKASDRYEILLKDCSFGGKYPAAALVMIEKNTGRFGVKVGCHPDYSIALERLFTEATQGISLAKFARKTEFDFYNDGVSTCLNLVNGYKTADARYPFQLFSDTSVYEFIEPKSVEDKNNDVFLEYMEHIFIQEGYDILIHDVSFLGFPSYQILVPGCSELNYPDDMYFEAENTRFHVQPLINQPELITKEECKYVISVVKYFKYNLLENTMRNLCGCLMKFDFPAAELGMDQYYFLAMCYAFMGEYDKAADEIHIINMVLQRDSIEKNAVFYRSMEQYLKGMAVKREHQVVMSFMYKLFDGEICKRLEFLMGEQDKILIKQYANVNLKHSRNMLELEKPELVEEFLVFEELCQKYINI